MIRQRYPGYQRRGREARGSAGSGSASMFIEQYMCAASALRAQAEAGCARRAGKVEGQTGPAGPSLQVQKINS